MEVEEWVEEQLVKSKERMKEFEYKLDQLSFENQEIMSELVERKNENLILCLVVEEVILVKEEFEMKFVVVEKEFYDEIDKVQQELDEKIKMIVFFE